jgi:hypothetical protein
MEGKSASERSMHATVTFVEVAHVVAQSAHASVAQNAPEWWTLAEKKRWTTALDMLRTLTGFPDRSHGSVAESWLTALLRGTPDGATLSTVARDAFANVSSQRVYDSVKKMRARARRTASGEQTSNNN